MPLSTYFTTIPVNRESREHEKATLLHVAGLFGGNARIGPKPPLRSFMPGPVIATDQVAYPNIGGVVGGSSGTTPGGYGIEGSYSDQRWLFSTKLLYRKRGYRQEPSYFEMRVIHFLYRLNASKSTILEVRNR